MPNFDLRVIFQLPAVRVCRETESNDTPRAFARLNSASFGHNLFAESLKFL